MISCQRGKEIISCQISFSCPVPVKINVKGNDFISKQKFPVKLNEFLSKEINSCQRRWFPLKVNNFQLRVICKCKRSQTNAEEDTDIAVSGGSDIIKSNE